MEAREGRGPRGGPRPRARLARRRAAGGRRRARAVPARRRWSELARGGARRTGSRRSSRCSRSAKSSRDRQPHAPRQLRARRRRAGRRGRPRGRPADAHRRHRRRLVPRRARRRPSASRRSTPRSAATRTARPASTTTTSPSWRRSPRHDRCRAIGETGLDFYRDRTAPDDQQRAFEAQIELARDDRQAARHPHARGRGPDDRDARATRRTASA